MLQPDIPVPDQSSPVGLETVLVVDDSRMQRRILCLGLRKRGFRVIEARTAQEGLDTVTTEQVDLVICAWVIPGMTGPEFCRTLRGLERAQYLYIILLTTKTETSEIADGLAAGADDFLSKPVNGTELAARIQAARRLLVVERQLTEKNRLVSETLSELTTLYEAIDRDLVEARKLQQSLVRKSGGQIGPAEVSLLLHPCGHVGGDLVGFYHADERQLGVYALDVSGHGVGSAMMTARLSGLLSGTVPGQNIAIERGPEDGIVARDPAEVAADLNRLLLTEMETELYFTLFLAVLELDTGELRAVQAGHPPAVIVGADGAARTLGDGGMPVGLIDAASFETVSHRLSQGDRLLLLSDGLSECENPTGTMLEAEGVAELAIAQNHCSTQELPQAILRQVVEFAERSNFDDDVSMLALDFRRSR